MKFSSKFNLKTNEPQSGAMSAIWLNVVPQDVATAISNGDGVGVPGDNGTPVQGDWEGGLIIEMNADGNWVKATHCVLGTDMPKLYFCVFSGNNDFSFDGSVFAFLGGRFETTKFDAASYTAGQPLVPSPSVDGNLSPKLSVSDNIKHVAYVGPRMLRPNGALDVIMPQST